MLKDVEKPAKLLFRIVFFPHFPLYTSLHCPTLKVKHLLRDLSKKLSVWEIEQINVDESDRRLQAVQTDHEIEWIVITVAFNFQRILSVANEMLN